MFTAIVLLLAQTVTAAPMPEPAEARERVAARDAEMFWYAFEGCDAGEVRARIADDFRMVHDQGGLVATNGDDFTAMIAEDCKAREEGGRNAGYSNRRMLVPGTDEITRLGDWGMLHRGEHTFHELRQRPAGHYGEGDPGGPTWVMTGGAAFINVWRWDGANERFIMQETISIDHGAARSYPPEG
ncbi:DUF4440 domain-containing protein [uncultured Erythrobacter sp.]|uniref:DUF4440 domain-containing protein n=1 Tax=uncultured Erythrobacter sp. TaxID=263913 RepID=UPI002627B3AD|nr:DUF4440 domain-containing protein [uncultured Erythrobacter sp.]